MYWIPENFKSGSGIVHISVFTVKLRNLLEGALLFLAILGIMMLTPFVTGIKIGATIFIGGGLFLFALNGIRGDSPTEYLISYIKFKTKRCQYHLRQAGVDYQKQQEKEEKRANKKKIKDR